jgi:hypothetical protein
MIRVLWCLGWTRLPVSGDIEYLAPEEARKARGFRSGHDGKTRDAGGKFRPMHADQVTVNTDGLPWRHNTRGMLPSMRRALGLAGREAASPKGFIE